MLRLRKICRFWEKWRLACLLQKLFLNAEFCFPLSDLYKNCPHQRWNIFFTKFFWESFVFCMIFLFPCPKIHSAWADINLIVLNVALTPPQSFNFGSQWYEVASQNQRKLWRAVVQRVKIWKKKTYTLLLSISAPLVWLSGLMISTFGSQSKNYVSSAIHFSYWIAELDAIK